MVFPAGTVVEWEQVPGSGVWSDITSSVLAARGLTVTRGRRDQFSQVSPGVLACTLENRDGRFTPGRQVLADGVTPAPWWPNVQPRRRVRLSYTVAGTRYYRFTGYIRGWPPSFDNGGVRSVVKLTAADRLYLLGEDSAQLLWSPYGYEVIADSPASFWPLGEAAGATRAADVFAGAPLQVTAGYAAPLQFGGQPLVAGDSAAVTFAPVAKFGQGLQGPNSVGFVAGFFSESVECVVSMPAAPPSPVGVVAIATGSQVPWSLTVYVDASGRVGLCDTATVSGAGSAPGVAPAGPVITDGRPHHVALTLTEAGIGAYSTLYVDGVAVGSEGSDWYPSPAAKLFVGSAPADAQAKLGVTASGMTGQVASVAVYRSVLSPARVAVHAAAVNGFAGELSGTRVARILRYAGVAAGDMSVSAGVTPMGAQSYTGKTPVALVQEVSDSESGGATLFVDGSGVLRWLDSQAYGASSPAWTSDAVRDVDGTTWTPSFDDQSLVASAAVTRQSAAGSQSTQTVSYPSSPVSGTASVTSWANSDADALAAAQWVVGSQSVVAFRLPQVTVDLLTSLTAGLAAAVAQTDLGTRFRVAGLPAQASPLPTVDAVVEGTTETLADSAWSIAFDASAADAPPFGVWDDPVYGRWGEDPGSLTVHTALTASATSLLVDVASGSPALSTATGDYPAYLTVGAEIVQVTAAPASSASPQTVPIARGQQGSTAAAQPAGSALSVWQPTGWAR